MNLATKHLIGISNRSDGNMKLPNNGSNDEEITKNRIASLKKHSIDPQCVVSAELEHGNNIRIVTADDKGQIIPHTDGLITWEKNVYLSITVADCLSITLYDSKKSILCLLHAGWKGLENKIVEKALTTLLHTYGIDACDLFVEIGPAIGPCHYEVSKDVAAKFSQYSDVAIERDSKIFLDLKKVAQNQLTDLGVQALNIETSDVCTYCQSETYFSHRKDQSNPVKAMIVVGGLI